MNIKNYLKLSTLLSLTLFLSIGFCAAQANTPTAPRQEKLLNGLKLLTWNEPNAEKVTLKLRIHSGSAFDVQTKEGTMALLGDILFPDAAAKEFFTQDLSGSLEIETTYDYIQITATAIPDQFAAMLETIANAVSNLQIDKNNTAKVVAARLEKVKKMEKNPSYIADQAVAKRLYGNFPYGRAQAGTSESLAKIDYADLIFARDKFLTPDNSTLIVSGRIKPDLVNRVVRRYFGAWGKSQKKIPATFAQPETPDVKELSITLPDVENGLYRSAIMTVGRDDKDFYAAKIVTEIRRNQFCYNDESKAGKLSFEPHLLRGTYLVSAVLMPSEPPSPGRNPCSLRLQKDGKTVYPQITQNDFEPVKSKAITELNQKMSNINDLSDLWLDVDTYKLVSVKDELQKANNVTLADVQRVAETLQKQPMVTVVVKKAVESK